MDEDYIAQIRRYAGRTGYVHLKDWAFGKYCILEGKYKRSCQSCTGIVCNAIKW